MVGSGQPLSSTSSTVEFWSENEKHRFTWERELLLFSSKLLNNLLSEANKCLANSIIIFSKRTYLHTERAIWLGNVGPTHDYHKIRYIVLVHVGWVGFLIKKMDGILLESVVPAVDHLLHLPPLPQQLQRHQARLIVSVLRRREWQSYKQLHIQQHGDSYDIIVP